ncbi:MAG: 3-oxoacyl-[acyl-carrier-protein] reductase [Candidatus Omnitrophica bacterium]|nr:3-oxoacyl-[acyl-carrier-protein] reductase [Candidatus Omnitrophota bacterium]
MNDPFLKNQTAVVTGASRGIGRAIALKLADLGANVAFNYQSSSEHAATLEKELSAKGVKAKGTSVDIKNFDQVKQWIEATKTEFGSLDILVNNAGIIRDKALMMMSSEDWQQVIDTNLTGVFNATRSCIVTFMKQKKGQIVNISSVSGVIGLPRQINYSASKGGINAFTKALAKEVASYGIRVNAVAPGFIETEILSGFNDEQKKKITEMIPLGRIGAVADVAGVVEYLLSDHAAYVTGQIIVVDGGLAIR